MNPRTLTLWGSVLSSTVLTSIAVGGEYAGRFTPDANYVLSGKLAADLPPLPKVPFEYVRQGYAAERLSEVPPVGVHPRVALSPSDIEAIRRKVALGEKADRVFRVMVRELRNAAARPGPDRPDFGGAPWRGIGVIAAKALLALISQDAKLGREAAEWTLRHARYIEPRIDILNTHPGARGWRENFYYFSRTGLRVGGVDYHKACEQGGPERVRELAGKGVEFLGQDNQWSFTSLGAEYDYAHAFLTDAERAYVRKVIAKSTRGKYSTGMEIPGHFFINNHMSMGAEFLPLALAIEGEDGYDERILKVYAPRLADKLTYDISPDGTLYENVKGFIPRVPILAAARRGGGDLLRHSHLLARLHAEAMNAEHLYNRYIHRGRARPREALPAPEENVEEARYWCAPSGRSLQFVWLVKHFHPADPVVDFLYKVRTAQANFDVFDGSDDETNYGGKIHYNDRNELDLQLLCATDGLRDEGGKVIDYTTGELTPAIEKLPLAWKDMRRGIAAARSSWDRDATVVHYECRSDFYYAGHETPEHGDFTLSAHGVQWSPYTGPYMDCYFRNMVLIDGFAGVYQPVAGRMIGVYDTPAAATFVSDATEGYRWRKREKLFELDHPMIEEAACFTDWEREKPFQLDRYTELPFPAHMRAFYDGFGHLDWGPWHGETRGPERYQKWNDVQGVYRTFHLARGKAPYALVIDDVQKDGRPHQYDWCLNVTGDAVLYSANSKAKNRHLTPDTEGAIGTDLVLCLGNTPRKQASSSGLRSHAVSLKPTPQKGDPMLLVRVLWRNTTFPYPLPSFEQAWQWNRIKVPAVAVRPEFRVLIFPFRFGDKLPKTAWSDDRSRLTVELEGQRDVYTFDQTDNGRTVFVMERDGRAVARTEARPERPSLDMPWRWRPDLNRTDNVRTHLFTDPIHVRLAPPRSGTEVRYTLDGSLPAADSAMYTAPIPLDRTATLKARTFHRDWRCGDDAGSRTLTVEFRRARPAGALKLRPQEASAGLLASVHEIKTTIYDERGFFTGTKDMLPDLDAREPILRTVQAGFAVPAAPPQSPTRQMTKAFYRYRGYFQASAAGVYRFRVDSCGPVVLRVGEAKVIDVTGQYGLSMKARHGEAALAEGLHALELTVTDPVFWKGTMEPPMEIGVAVMAPGRDEYEPVRADRLFRERTLRFEAGEGKMIGRGTLRIVAEQPDTEARFTLDGSEPTARSPVARGEVVLASPGRHVVRAALFKGPRRVGEVLEKDIVVLAAPKAAGVGKVAGGLVERRYDWTAAAPADGRVPANGLPATFLDLPADARPYAQAPVAAPAGNDCLRRLVEYRGFFRAAREGVYAFRLDPRGVNGLRIGGVDVTHNRLLGPRGPGCVYLEAGLHELSLRVGVGKATLEAKAPGADGFEPVSTADLLRPARVPAARQTDRLAAYLPFEDLAGGRMAVKGESPEATATVEAAEIVAEGRAGKALRCVEPAAKVVVEGLKMLDDEATFAIWLKRERLTDGYLLVAPDKFAVRLRGKGIWAAYHRSPDTVSVNGDKAVEPGKWFHLAVSFGEEVRVYLNGELRGSAQVDRSAFHTQATDARAGQLVLFNEPWGRGPTPAVADEARLYNRVLTAEEILRLAEGAAPEGAQK